MSKTLPQNRRTLWFGAASFFASALACWNIYVEGGRSGVLRFGGRHLQVISRTHDPSGFETWSTFFVVAGTASLAAGIFFAWIALRWKKRDLK